MTYSGLFTADAVREEVDEIAQVYPGDFTEDEMDWIANLPDQEIEDVFENAIDDDFWMAYDLVRQEAIAVLRSQYLEVRAGKV